MKKSRFTGEQITNALRQVEAGTPPADVCRPLGCSEASFYLWKKRYGNLGLTEVKSCGSCAMRTRGSSAWSPISPSTNTFWPRWCEKKTLKPTRRREVARWMRVQYEIAIARSCRLAGLSRAGWYKRSVAKDQSGLRMRISDIAYQRPRFGYQRIHVMLRREGWPVNKKRVRRLYRKLTGRGRRLRASKLLICLDCLVRRDPWRQPAVAIAA